MDKEMDVRKKLVELLDSYYVDYGAAVSFLTDQESEDIAELLIANGVTVQEWISVKDRLPDTIPCGAGTEYSEAVNVLTDGRKVLTAIWNGLYWICDAEFWDAEFEEITHWTPVLLPLPQPPKGE